MADGNSVSAIIADLRSRYVFSERDDAMRRHLHRRLAHDDAGAPLAQPALQRSGESGGIMVTGPSGAGKNWLIGKAIERTPALGVGTAAELLDRTTDGPLTCLFVRVPSPATLKSLGLTIIKACGLPVARLPAERWAIWDLARIRLKTRGVVVLWIDEVHNLFRTGADRDVREILDAFKSLMQGGDEAVVLILSGTRLLFDMTKIDPETSRRLTKLHMPVLCDAVHGDELRGLIEAYCAKAGLEPPDRGDLVGRLIHGARGAFGRCLDMTINAIEEALTEGHRQLDIQHFADAFAMHEGCDPEGNVFLAPSYADIELDLDPDRDPDPEPSGTRKRPARKETRP
ncbi:AAA family ATPase [Rhodovulum sp. 12E13]|uniref:TniB family NTP-binding protein n=1 Tax=Rhodovulum sp. 12E13 TaxID=2203891 RepID=UPI000E124CF6|nr:TniB family NTP-binding protein [Rhodovulum sp. 12E13]RDC69002.1 AAA family ATPase [Rhodovulum sp. 12E13]